MKIKDFYHIMMVVNLILALMNGLVAITEHQEKALIAYCVDITFFFVFKGLYNRANEADKKNKKND